MELFLTNFSEAHRVLVYLLIFLLMLAEGEVVLMLAGILSRNGYLDFSAVLAAAFMGSIAHDFLYWRVGRRFKETKGKFLGINAEKAGYFLDKFKSNEGWRLFVSKFAWGFTRVFLMGNGYGGTPIKRILKYTAPAGLIWVSALTSLGYVFAYKIDILKRDFTTGLILLSLFIAFIFAVEYLLRWVVGREKS